MRSLLANRRHALALGIVVAYAALNSLVNLYVIGGSAFIYRLNTVLPVLWGALALYLLARLLVQERDNAVASRVYRWMLWGLALWVLGDLIWGLYVFLFRIEIPYPSWADLAWVAGYPFIFYALYLRIRSYGVSLTSRNRWLLGGILVLLILGAVGFILLPIVQDYDPTRLGESALNILYPSFDTIALILTLVVFFTLERGKFAVPWAVITVAFVFNSVADLMIYRALWLGTYYPEGQANLVSLLIDAIYNLLYPCLCLGFYAARDLTLEREAITEQLAARHVPETPKASFEIFTDAEGCVISVSENLFALLNTRDRSKILGVPLEIALKMGRDQADEIQGALQRQGYIRDVELSVVNSAGQRSQGWLTGFPTHDSRGVLTGANLVLQVQVDASFAAPPLTRESMMLVTSILQQAGVLDRQKQEAERRRQQVRFQEQMELLYELLASEGNRRIARAMELACQQLAKDRGWPFRFSDGQARVISEGDPAVLEEAYPLLLATARAHAARVLGEDLIRAELARLEATSAADAVSGESGATASRR